MGIFNSLTQLRIEKSELKKPPSGGFLMRLSKKLVETVFVCTFRNKPCIKKAVSDAQDGETCKADGL
jgi:hypothetical protein